MIEILLPLNIKFLRLEISFVLDSTWAKKDNKPFFEYKLHSKSDVEYGLIRNIKTRTASVHDSQVDLTKPDEVGYKDKGYFGAISKGFSVTMRRSVRGHTLCIRDILGNKRISRKRAN